MNEDKMPENSNNNPPELEPVELKDSGRQDVQQNSVDDEVPKHSGHSKKSKSAIASVLLLVLVIILGLVSGYFYNESSSAQADLDLANEQLEILSADTHPLPNSAVKVSECIPNMGFHYMMEGGTPEQGPFYLVNNNGEVIGVEVMFSKDQFLPIEAGAVPIEVLDTGAVDLFGWTYQTTDVTLLPEGHELFYQEHYDVHLYTVSPEVQAEACS